MTITHETFDIVIDGAPPYGFRLIQKLMDNSLVVSKLRQQGKASEAGLVEGDVLVGVNSRSCEGFNCTQALNLIDSSSLPLVLSIKRKSGSKAPHQNQQAPVRTGYVPLKQHPKPSPAKSPQLLPWQISPQPSPIKPLTPTHHSSVIVVNPPSHPSPHPPNFATPHFSPQPPPYHPPLHPSPRSSMISQIKLTSNSHQEPTKVYVGSTRHSLSGDEQVIVNFGEQVSKKVEPEEEIKFSDTSFFGPAGDKYPTIEEQVQLARRVAQSVLAPVNVHSKGHRMFLKAKERAAKYTTGADEEDVENSFAMPGKLHEMPKKIAYVPKLPTETTNDRINAMSNEEIELLKLQQRKNPHTGVSPQVCFNLASDLKNMRGKGGRMFAKRQAKAKSWTLGAGEEEELETNGDVAKQKKVMDSLNIKHNMEGKTTEPRDNRPQLGYGKSSDVQPLSEQHQEAANRLESLIKATKSIYSPWDAAEKFGNIERAFDHLQPVSPMNYSTQWEGPGYQQTTSQTISFASHSAVSPMTQSYNPVQFNPSMAYSDV